MASYILGFYLLLVTTPIGWAQSASGAGNQGQQKSSSAAAPLEDFERRIGPLKIKHQNFTVVLHLKRVRGSGLSAIAKARRCAASRCSIALTGTSVQPSSFAARTRPWPAITLCSASISTGALKPKLLMLLAICRTCLRLCSRGFCGLSLNATIGS
jgi:hypothetical protein